MTALATDRATPRIDGELLEPGAAASQLIYAGALVMLNSAGNAEKGATKTGCFGVGVAEARCDNSAGSAGDLTVKVRTGVFRFANSADADLIAVADVGKTAWVVDDQTVAKTNGSAARSPAGPIVWVDSNGVWVRLGWHAVVESSGALLAANNLSDIGTAATARVNLGVSAGVQSAPTIATPGAEVSNTITTAVQLKGVAGSDLAVRGSIYGYLAADANGDTITNLTIASLTQGTDGLVFPLDAANRTFFATSEADGDIDVAVGCTGTGTCYLILVSPAGGLVASAAITFA